MKKIAIIGGGISGLSAAYFLQEQAGSKIEVSLFEEKSRLGGVIETQVYEGAILEGGPDCFLSKKPAGRDLCEKLGLAQELISTREGHRRSYILRAGKLQQVPAGFYLMAPRKLATLFNMPFLSLGGKLRAACDLFLPKGNVNDESIAGFMRRRMGREVFERVGQPMVGGIYGGDPEKLSLQATLPQFKEMEKRHGSILRGLKREQNEAHKEASGPRYSLFLSLKQGMEQLVRALAQEVSGVKVYTACAVKWVQPNSLSSPHAFSGDPKLDSRLRGNDATWELYTEDGRSFSFDAVLFAVPAFAAAKSVRMFAPLLADALESIRYESIATVNLLYRKSDIPASFNGIGFVAPKIEGTRISACTYSNLKFEGRTSDDYALLRVFVGGALYQDAFQLDDKAMEQMVKEELGRIAGIQEKPLFVSIRRYPQSMPQYHVGHLEKVKSIQALAAEHPGLFLTGNAFEGIGIPDCIQQAETRVRDILSFLHV